tara:strand:- start:970 stop:1623 length:654 start_codon:yes stop_codon:yes gene_type:complete
VNEETILGSTETEESGETTLVTEPETKEDEVTDGSSNKEDDKTEEEKGETTDGKDSTADKPDGAPEAYEDFIIPDGLEADEDVMVKASEMFRELDLTQEKAQKLVDFQVKVKQKEIERATQLWEDTVNDWKDKSKSDKEFGGAAFNASMVEAKAAINAFGNTEFKEMLNLTGVGNHPEMIRFLQKMGKTVKADEILQGSSSAGGEVAQAKKLFPDMN